MSRAAPRRRPRASLLGLALAGLLSGGPAAGEVLLADDFEYFPPGSGVHGVSPPAGTGAPLTRVWDQVVYWHGAHAIQIVCDGSAASGHCHLVENLVPGGQGASELRDHAERAPSRWRAPHEEVWVRHFVRWPPGWEWPPGFTSLKLGRLRLADRCPRGGACVETYWGVMHGDPSRLRWTYAYTASGQTWCCPGNEVAGAWPGGFRTGRWYCVELHLRQSSRVAPPDGLMEIYVDGERVAASDRIDTGGGAAPGPLAWRLFSLTDNFVGVAGGAAATAKTPAVHFDGVVVSTTRAGCPPPRP